MVRTLLSIAVTGALISPITAVAQDASAPATEPTSKKVGQVIITGTRVANRTVADSVAPIDVISPAVLESTGTTELATALSRALPSLNFPRPSITDGTDAVRPAQLRGLSPDQVLVLINGKRMHTTAMLNLNGSQGRGSSPVDLNTIPISAVERVEVLRDGAAAQYGSDAIAGVINIVLKGSGKGGSVSLRGGQYSAGDGQSVQLAVDSGFRYADGRGSIHLSASALDQQQSDRAAPFLGAALPANPPLGKVSQRFGDPDIRQYSIAYNTRFSPAEGVTFYSFATASRRNALSNGLFRSAGNDNNIPSIYPEGFLPLIRTLADDQTFVAGLRGQIFDDVNVDLSYNYGHSGIDFEVENSLNRSLGPNSQTQFYAGSLDLKQHLLTLDFSKTVGADSKVPISVSWGAEWRGEQFQQGAGELNSFTNGGVKLPNGSAAASGSQGFPGYKTTDAGDFDRNSYAAYIDLEANPIEALTLGLAGRYEKYSDFGSTSSGKFSARYDFNSAFALRGTYSTGFRAPSLQQQFFQSTVTSFIPVAGFGSLPFEIRTFRVNDPAAIALGAEPLRAEKSRNASIGAVFQGSNGLYLTVDAYQIMIKDRITLSENLRSDAVRNFLNANGYPDIGGGRYFTNAIDTTTKGIDVVGTYRSKFSFGTIDWTAAYNYNKTEIDRIASNPAALAAIDPIAVRFGRTEIARLVEGSPRDKILLGGVWKSGPWSVGLTATRYGRFTTRASTASGDQTYAAKWLTDVTASYKVRGWDFTLGADNIFDTYPDRVLLANSVNGQLPYSSSSPFGFNGAFVYGKIGYSWK